MKELTKQQQEVKSKELIRIAKSKGFEDNLLISSRFELIDLRGVKELEFECGFGFDLLGRYIVSLSLRDIDTVIGTKAPEILRCDPQKPVWPLILNNSQINLISKKLDKYKREEKALELQEEKTEQAQYDLQELIELTAIRNGKTKTEKFGVSEQVTMASFY